MTAWALRGVALVVALVLAASVIATFAQQGGRLFAHSGPLAGASAPAISGTYFGTVHNTTIDERGPIEVVLTQDQSSLTGRLLVGYPLAGSGPIAGTLARDGTLSFEVQTRDESGFVLEFTGTASADGATLTGSYTVNNGQVGIWDAERSPRNLGAKETSYAAQ